LCNDLAKASEALDGKKKISVCGVNSTVGLPEKLRVAVDQTVAILLAMMRSVGKTRKLPWIGRTFDLKSAYKQFGVSESDANLLKIALKSGPDAVKLFDVLALPFGATGSVVAFLRVAASPAFIGTNGLYICWSSFFDDFTSVTPQSLAENIKFYIESMFRLIGIDFAAEGDKVPPYDRVFKSLGLQFDLSSISRGYFALGHTESRRKELLEQIETMTEGRDISVSVKELERLHGRLVWFNAFVFGRTLKAAVGVISKFSRSPSKTVKVEGPLKDALTVLKAELAKDEPVLVREAVTKTWTVFTDGAYEPDGTVKASIGGVLVNEEGLVVECFGIELDDGLREEFLADSQHPTVQETKWAAEREKACINTYAHASASQICLHNLCGQQQNSPMADPTFGSKSGPQNGAQAKT